MGRASQQKGKRGEYELAERLSKITGRTIERAANHDITGFDGLHCECKRTQFFAINKWLEQATNDAGERIPFVCFRRNNEQWKVVLELDNLRPFVERMFLNFYSESEVENVADKKRQGKET